MTKPVIGIIGGTGFAEALTEQTEGRTEHVDTPFGPPSSPVRTTQWNGLDIACISRHGDGHVHPPSAVPYRANIFALKTLGVTHILAITWRIPHIFLLSTNSPPTRDLLPFLAYPQRICPF